MRRPALTALCLVPVLLWLSPVSAADMSSFVGEPSAWQQAVAWILDQQRLFHRELAGDLRALQAGGSAAATWTLVVVSFLYGVFHAAGPGHGKAVIATYLLTHESRLGRGLWLAAASSLCQGMVAVLLVSGLVAVAGWLPHDTQSAVLWSERFSFVLLAGLGMVFALRAARDLVLVFRRPGGHHHHDHHGDHHEH
ncbi:MAG TPA: hypothetical protein VL974_01490, partial [Magnetospirillum sp.]|nr:hypothetical protein [Magnetospirillum sp.]